MKKTKKSKSVGSRSSAKSNTGMALLFCFLLASIAVAYTLRQLALERRLIANTQLTDATSTRMVGTYQVTVPATSSPGRLITLTLSSDRSVELTQDFHNSEPPKVEKGSWSGDSNGTIIVTLGPKTYAFSYSPTATGALRLLNPDVEVWGAATLTLTRK